MKSFAPFLVVHLVVLGFTSAFTIYDDLEVIRERRIQDIIQGSHSPGLANKWREEITAQGNWTDVDYTVGCPASRPDWKAPEHVRRIITMASLWSHNNSDVDLLNKINLALDHWFVNDFTDEGCITGGSIERYCPCGTPGFWNPNWWYQMILMPRLVGNACLLLQSALSQSQLSICIHQTMRAYIRIDGDPDGPMGKMTGANLLDVTWTGVTIALLTSDLPIMQDAYARSFNESELTYGGEDGIKVDGSFMQHSGQLLTGSYGSVFITNMIKIFLETRETTLEPPESVQSAFLTLIDGCEWFIYHKNGTGNETEDPFSPLLMWEYSVIGRSISHKYSDWRGIGFNLNALLNATSSWGNYPSFQAIVERLQTKGSVNPGGLVGTRYFHVTDYLVHRGLNYIITLKMYSKRTTNSECYNAQNPFGFHLSDGAIWTYLDGNEYTDVAGGWDWYLIPGSTVPYEQTPLVCHQVEYKGKESFVGGLAFGQAGIAVMNYTNPNPAVESVSWTKTFFVFPNSYVVQFVGPVVAANPVFTTLDQRHLSGPVVVDGEVLPEVVKVRRIAQTLWHDRVGYKFVNPVNLTVDTIHRQSDWEEIGTSVGNETLKLVAAYFEHPPEQQIENYFTYITYLDVSLEDFVAMTESNSKVKVSPSTESVQIPEIVVIVRGASYGQVGSASRIISLVFLTPGEYFTGLEDITKVETDSPVLLLFQRKEGNAGWQLGISDPTQTLARVIVRVTLAGTEEPKNVVADLPSGAWGGSMVLYEI